MWPRRPGSLSCCLSVCPRKEKNKKQQKTKPEHKNPCHLQVSSVSPGLLSSNSCRICLKSLESEPCLTVSSWRPLSTNRSWNATPFWYSRRILFLPSKGGRNPTMALAEESLQEVDAFLARWSHYSALTTQKKKKGWAYLREATVWAVKGRMIQTKMKKGLNLRQWELITVEEENELSAVIYE